MNAIYTRVSTDEQARTGYSLDDQAAQCRQKLYSLGLTDIQEYVDEGYSGEYLERPGLDRLREDMRQGVIENIVVYDPDRLSRNLTNQLLIADEIDKAGIRLMFVTGDYDCSPEGRLFFSIRGAISAFEKAKISERTQRGRKSKAKQGKIPINCKPYGFDWDTENSMYTINESEAANVALIYSICLSNHWGCQKIAQEMTSRGVLNREGKPFNYMAIYRILTKELYCGTAYSGQVSKTKTGQHTYKRAKRPKDEWISIKVPSIIPLDTWKQVQQVIKQNRTLSSRNTKQEQLLRGIIRCGVCGMGLTVTSSMRNGEIRRYYRCVTKSNPLYRHDNTCNNRYVPVDALEEDVWQVIIDISSNSVSFDKFIRSDNIPDKSRDIERLTKQHDDAKKKQLEILKWYRSNLIDANVADTELASVAKDISNIVDRLNKMQAAQDKIKKLPVISSAEILNAATIEEKRSILLRYGLEVHVRKLENDIEFWFKH